MLSREFCKIFRNIFFTENFQATASKRLWGWSFLTFHLFLEQNAQLQCVLNFRIKRSRIKASPFDREVIKDIRSWIRDCCFLILPGNLPLRVIYLVNTENNSQSDILKVKKEKTSSRSWHVFKNWKNLLNHSFPMQPFSTPWKP